MTVEEGAVKVETGATPEGGQDGGKKDADPEGEKKEGGKTPEEGKAKVDRVGDLTLKVPEQLKEELWTKDIKTPEDLWNKLAGAQKLIGKKGIIPPAKDAPQEEWESFYNAQGRPENPEGYEFKSIEELKDVPRNPELDNRLKNIFHKRGVSKEVTEAIVAETEKVFYEMTKPELEKTAKQIQESKRIEEEFVKLKTQVLGQEAESTTVAFKSVLKETLGDRAFLAQKLDTMDNDALLSLMVFAKNIHDKYVGENKIPNTPGSTSNMTGDLKTDFQALSQQKLAVKTDKNLPEHVRAQKLMHINSQMMKLGSKAQDAGIDLFS
jgi:hypothetical protein